MPSYPLLPTNSDPLGISDLTTSRVPLHEAPEAYEVLQKKQGGAIKVVFAPSALASTRGRTLIS